MAVLSLLSYTRYENKARPIRGNNNDTSQVEVPILSNSECNSLLKKSGQKEDVREDMWVCAGYSEGGKDACDVSRFSRIVNLVTIIFYLSLPG